MTININTTQEAIDFITKMKSPLALIVAISENNVIGINNKIPWHLSEDLKYFKQITTGHSIIMGRKTYESIGKPLPNRRNIVVSKTLQPTKGIEVYSSIIKAILAAKQDDTEPKIIGGAEIYKQSIQFCSKLYITYIKKEVTYSTNDNVSFFTPSLYDKKDFPIKDIITETEDAIYCVYWKH